MVSKGTVFRRFEDLLITGELPQLLGNATYNDIRHLVPDGEIKYPRVPFLTESAIAVVVHDRELALEMWQTLSETRYDMYL